MAALKSAKAVLSDEIGAIEACWVLSSFALTHEALLSKGDRNLFVGVQSETDALPVGSLKDNWHPDFLPAKLEQLERYEAAVSSDVKDACRRLVVALEAQLAGVESR
jgi:hypothetical protein